MHWGKYSTTNVRRFLEKCIFVFLADFIVSFLGVKPKGEHTQRPESDNSTFRFPPEIVVEQVLSHIDIPASTFNCFLHENYLRFYVDIDDVAGASAYLSDCSDLLSCMQVSSPTVSISMVLKS